MVSGVGGQLNFVLHGDGTAGCALDAVPARRRARSAGDVQSNMRFAYGHATVPRHLRDIVVTEYGCADLRGRTDAEVIAALLGIADSRFQPQLLAEAQRHRKMAADYRMPGLRYATTRRSGWPTAFAPASARPVLRVPVRYRFHARGDRAGACAEAPVCCQRPRRRADAGTASRAHWSRARARSTGEALVRMGLAAPAGWRERLDRSLVSWALGRTEDSP